MLLATSPRIKNGVRFPWVSLAGLIACTLANGHAAEQPLPPLKDLETQVRGVLKAVNPASVVLSVGGSGVIVDRSGLLLTCNHVASKSREVRVFFPDGRNLKGKVLGSIPSRDIAMVQLPEGDYPFVPIGDTTKLRQGEVVIVLGHPNGPEPGRSIQARLGRILSHERLGMVSHDSEIIPGDSGSGLFNLKGELVGLNSECLHDVPDNLASDVNVAKLFWDDLKAGRDIDGPEQLKRVLAEDARFAGLDVEGFVKHLNEASGLPSSSKESGTKEKPDDKDASEKGKEKETKESPKKEDPRSQERRAQRYRPEKLREWLKEHGLPNDRLDAADLESLQGLVMRTYRNVLKDRTGVNHGQGLPPNVGLRSRIELIMETFPGLDREKIKGKLTSQLEKPIHVLDFHDLFLSTGAKEKEILGVPLAHLMAMGHDLLACGHDHGADVPGYQDSRKSASAHMKDWLAAGKPMADSLKNSVVAFNVGGTIVSLGTVVRKNGWIVTKASELQGHSGPIRCRLPDGSQLDAKLVETDDLRDLALVKVDAANLAPIVRTAALPETGQMLISPDRSGPIGVGIMSGTLRTTRIAPRLGIEAGPEDDKFVVKRVLKGGSADGFLEVKDEVISVDCKPVKNPTEILRALDNFQKTHAAKDPVIVAVKRGDDAKEISVPLKPFPGDLSPVINRLAVSFAVPLSRRANGFPRAFYHDQSLRADQCGGPVITLSGDVVGLNIARRNRVETVALPWSEVDEFLKSALPASEK